MNRSAHLPRRPPAAGADPAAAEPQRWSWPARAGLLLLSAVLLSLALAPVNQFYLAWVGLAPWLLAVGTARTGRSSFLWGLAGGWVFFLVNMWWLWFVSVPGLFALTLYLALFWGLAALVTRVVLRRAADQRRHPLWSITTVLLVAAGWTAFEWLRGNVSFLGRQGLPWLYLGQTQSPLLVMCQIADITSVLGVTFWVVAINALLALLYLKRGQLAECLPAAVAVLALLVGIGVYGAFRLQQDALFAGPTVLVVQSNYKQSNTGEKGAPLSEIVRFHLHTTYEALRQVTARGEQVDLVVWSETMMPPLNESARAALRGTNAGEFWQQTHDDIARLASEFRSSFLVGGTFSDDWQERDGYLMAADRRNTAYFFDSTGRLGEAHYDKVHLVPFGEYIPFESIPPVYRLFVQLGPNYYEDYILTRGEGFEVFTLDEPVAAAPTRFVAPICFEDIVPSLITGMLWDPQARGKRADLLVNITNDGWFRANQMAQHLQAALFRSIENRVPTARSVNTGVSGYVDSRGRVLATVPAGTEGWSVQSLSLDRRVALYTRIGDVFPIICVALTAGVCVAGVAADRRRKQLPNSGVVE